jgi:hypothetical protein
MACWFYSSRGFFSFITDHEWFSFGNQGSPRIILSWADNNAAAFTCPFARQEPEPETQITDRRRQEEDPSHLCNTEESIENRQQTESKGQVVSGATVFLTCRSDAPPEQSRKANSSSKAGHLRLPRLLSNIIVRVASLPRMGPVWGHPIRRYPIPILQKLIFSSQNAGEIWRQQSEAMESRRTSSSSGHRETTSYCCCPWGFPLVAQCTLSDRLFLSPFVCPLSNRQNG